MNDSLFVSLDRLLLEFVFQYEQDVSTKEDMIQRINKSFEDIKQNKATICKIQETINTTDEEIGHYCKHSKEIKDNCSGSQHVMFFINMKTICRTDLLFVKKQLKKTSTVHILI
uniref:Uncharacterized protein n=1 Tax=Molossus molossus TaxID=27622 RepID=A0A7J8JR26_MOLMO|nr:hypothetical protein HJG59_001701 [Molossus molossus]